MINFNQFIPVIAICHKNTNFTICTVETLFRWCRIYHIALQRIYPV